MTTQNFMIGPINNALNKNIKPFASPADSFEVLTNAYQFRGRIIKRSGYTSLARLSPDGITFPGNPVMGLRTRETSLNQRQLIGFDTTTAYLFAAGAFSTLPSFIPVIWSGTNSQFFFTTNYAAAFWATNSKEGLHGRSISGIDNANPAQVTTAVPHGFSSAPKPQYVSIINVSGYTPISTATPILNGQNFQITVTGVTTFTLTGLNGALYNAYISGGIALNSQVSIAGQDGIRYYADVSNNATPTVPIGDSWVNYNPPIDTANALAGASLIFPYRGYLVFLNTWEGNEVGVFNYPQRARWTQIGTPYYSNPVPNTPSLQGVDIKTARDDLFGRGGANDAPTNENIIGAAFIRDILIVYFTRSTWRLRFVNNAQNPFVWERINIELGSESTFSTVPFDKALMAIGTRGIVKSDANDTIRFDESIPDDVFEIRQANEGLKRVYGIRTFKTRLVYWAFPSNSNPTAIFPDQVLVYNYETKNWAYFDDSFTCFGYYYLDNPGLLWSDLVEPWSSYNDTTWDSAVGTAGFETVIAGNQQGYVFQLEQTSGSNSPSLSISNIVGSTVTSTNYNLADESWIKLTGVTGTTFDDGVSLNGRNFKIAQIFDNVTGLLLLNSFNIFEFEPLSFGNAVGTSYQNTIGYTPILAGSVQINIGALVFTDPLLNGSLIGTGGSGTINYDTGLFSLTFSPAIGSTPVFVRVVSLDDEQTLVPVSTTGAYTGSGEITKLSNFDITTKIFNFFNDDKRSRLSKIDFYVDTTQHGQFTCNVLTDSSNQPANVTLSDNPQSNVVLTSLNPYQFGTGDETIYRLYADAVGQTIQLQMLMTDRQIAVDAINSSDLELLAMMFTLKRGGRLV